MSVLSVDQKRLPIFIEWLLTVGMTITDLTDYLIECSRNTEIKVTDLSEVLMELKRIGNNINQIARKVNSKRFFFGNFNSVIEGQHKIYDAILNMTGDDS